jgi:hypothetical protein
MTAPQNTGMVGFGGPYAHVIALVRWTRLGVALAGGLALVFLWVGPDLMAQPFLDHPAPHVALDIMPVRPGGPAENYAAYLPTTALRVPAHSMITVTIRNFDLDPTPVPVDSPYARVQGTIGGVAYADGVPYTVLDRTRIAHTFTVPGLHLNVPIPGRAASGEPDVVVTFNFRTLGTGTYRWKCFDPCGDGPDGLGGPMADVDYMQGTLAVVP